MDLVEISDSSYMGLEKVVQATRCVTLPLLRHVTLTGKKVWGGKVISSVLRYM